MPLHQRRQTDRLCLRPPSEGDAAAHLALFAHPLVVRHRPDPRPLGPVASAAKLARDMAHWRAHGFGRWVVRRRLDGELIGFGGVTWPEDDHGFDRALNLSYHVYPAFWGRGYATELARTAVRFAFDGLAASHVIGLARAWNQASARVLEHTGMVFQREIELGGAPSLLYTITRPSA